MNAEEKNLASVSSVSQTLDTEAPLTLGGKPVEVTLWAGISNYHCPECSFDNTDLFSLQHHFVSVHNRPKVERQSAILGTDGEPLIVTDTEEEES